MSYQPYNSRYFLYSALLFSLTFFICNLILLPVAA